MNIPFPPRNRAALVAIFLCSMGSVSFAQTQAKPASGKKPHPAGTPAVVPVANTAAPTPAPTPPGILTSADTVTAEGDAKPNPADPSKTETEILASQGANFASKERIAVFVGDVRVYDPRFTLACDKLTVFLAKGANLDGAATPAPTPTPTPTPAPQAADATGNKPPKDPSNPGGGIDHAVAEGHVIIIQKRPPAKPGDEPKTSIGKADRGEFDNKTGDMTLIGTPSVEQNGNTHVALAPSVIMILHKDNSMETHGPSKTTLIQKKGAGASFDLPGGDIGKTAPSPSPGPGAKPAASPGASPTPQASPAGRHQTATSH